MSLPTLNLEKDLRTPSFTMDYPRWRTARRNSCGNARTVLWLALTDTLPEGGAADKNYEDLNIFTIRDIDDSNFPALKANRQVKVQPHTVDSGRQIGGVPTQRLLWTLGLPAAASALAHGAVTAREDDAPAAIQAAIVNVAALDSISAGCGLIQITSG